jgi:hypothetical protein
MCSFPNGFRDGAISLYSSKIVYKEETLVLFLIPIFIVQVTKLVQFTQYNTFSIIPQSTSTHFATRVRTWRVVRLGEFKLLYSENSETVQNRIHVHI